ncbi:MAG: ABC transporter substrate-binding protein [Holosporaceae bacterium]|jgi:polar amino acid transport system substrate-binding protein|nr:ABC transporter substrate-binding protein [Holosporaceae bacterium]
MYTKIVKAFFSAAFAVLLSILCGCDDAKNSDELKIAVCADYPPFEYYENGELTGFDIDIAKLIGQELKQKVKFEEMQFPAILASLQQKAVDAAISAIAITEERKKKNDFSSEYYSEASFATVYKKSHPVRGREQLEQSKVACQLGSTMEIWLKANCPRAIIVAIDNNNQAVEMLKAGHVNCVFINLVQGKAFCLNNDDLGFSKIAESANGYAVALQKGSGLREKIDKAIEKLKSTGKIDQLRKKWSLE